MSIFDTEKVIAIEEHYIDPNVTKLQEESTKTVSYTHLRAHET